MPSSVSTPPFLAAPSSLQRTTARGSPFNLPPSPHCPRRASPSTLSRLPSSVAGDSTAVPLATGSAGSTRTSRGSVPRSTCSFTQSSETHSRRELVPGGPGTMAAPAFAAAASLRAMAGGGGPLAEGDDDSATEALLKESSDGLAPSAVASRRMGGAVHRSTTASPAQASRNVLVRTMTDDTDDSFVPLNGVPEERDVEADWGEFSKTTNNDDVVPFSSAHSALVRTQQSIASLKEDRGDSTELKAILNRTSSLRHVGDPPDHDGQGSLGELYSTLSQANKPEEDSSVVYLPAWTVDPDSGWYPQYQFVLLALSVVAGLVVPFNIAFLDPSNLFSASKLFMYAIDAVFVFDIGLSFFVPKFQDGEWKTNLPEIRWAYLQGMLTWDLVAAVPWDLIGIALLRPNPGPEMLSLTALGFLRLVRLQRLWMFLWDAGSDFRFNYFSISIQKLLFLTMYAVHWAACVFFFLARFNGFAPYTWVGRCDPSLAVAPAMEAYVTSLYWAMTTLSTTGYGDLSAYTTPERIWTVFFMLINLAITAYVIGNMTVLLTKADAAMAAYRDKLTSVTGYMSAHQVPRPLQQQVQSHLKLQFETSSLRDDVLSTCPSNVRTRVARHVYSGFVNKPYLFRSTSALFRDQLTTQCREEFFLPNVEVMRAGDSITDMYIIASGRMKAFVKDYNGERVGWMDYEDGATVGEFAFLCEQTQLWTVKTTSTCRVLCISRDAYSKLARAHPADSHQVVSNLLTKTQTLVDFALTQTESTRASQRRLVSDIAQLLQSEVEAFQSMMTQETIMRLCYAAKRGDTLELFRLSAGGFDINQADYDGRTPLHLAAVNGQDKAVEYLIEKGADVNAVDAFHRTPLLEAVSAGHVGTAELLKRNGARLDLENESTLLCRLASQGNADQIRRLLDYGANADAADYDGRTALHIAAADGHLTVVKALVEAGASTLHLDRWKRSPMDEAKSRTRDQILDYLMRAVRPAQAIEVGKGPQ